MQGERNFHIFYQLLRGDDHSQYQLSGNPADYYYTHQGGADTVRSVDDRAEYLRVKEAMSHVGFKEAEVEGTLRVVAGILHLGNIRFQLSEDERTVVSTPEELARTAKTFQVPVEALERALTQRTVKNNVKNGVDIATPIGLVQAAVSRDAIAKATYDRLFGWIVRKINENITARDTGNKCVIGVLDIYGFEILQTNGFEQFCINYCNEKLQQLFIELTLKAEQEEYLREGIQWTPVEYFNNAVICKLIDESPAGMLDKLDEECLRPGETTPETLMSKFNAGFANHAHYESRGTNLQKLREMPNTSFRLKHYAGEVTYDTTEFLDRNRDLLFKDLLYCLGGSSLTTLKEMFPEKASGDDLKRPPSAGSQFKKSMSDLVALLLSKSPHYVRCIKPNDTKSPALFDDQLVLHQVRYLGLLENVRVRRAGFCFRDKYDSFLERYKMTTPVTWPFYRGPGGPREGANEIMKSRHLPEGAYLLGKSKLFIRIPSTLKGLEESRTQAKHTMITGIKANYLAHLYARSHERQVAAATLLETISRRFVAELAYARANKAQVTIARLVRGLLARRRFRELMKSLPRLAAPVLQRQIKIYLKRVFLHRLSRAAHYAKKDWRNIKWPQATSNFSAASEILLTVYRRFMARRYRRTLPAARKAMLEEKLYASDLLKGRKKSYPPSVGVPFVGDALELGTSKRWAKIANGEKVVFSQSAIKPTIKNLSKLTERTFALTSEAIYLLEKHDQLKYRIPLVQVTGISLLQGPDCMLVVHLNGHKKGDLFLIINNDFIGAVTRLSLLVKAATKSAPRLTVLDRLGATFAAGQKVTIVTEKSVDPEFSLRREKDSIIVTLDGKGCTRHPIRAFKDKDKPLPEEASHRGSVSRQSTSLSKQPSTVSNKSTSTKKDKTS